MWTVVQAAILAGWGATLRLALLLTLIVGATAAFRSLVS
jgi:hypothetical protein